MQAPIQITFHGVQHSDAIEEYVRKRADKLDTLDPRVVACRVALELPHRHAHHGEHYRVRIDIRVPGGEVVVERVPEGDRAYEDVYAAIDAAFDDASRRLQDFVRRQRGEVKRHEGARHGVVTKLFPYEGYGFLRTPEGDELYFHRNAVLDGAFDRLKLDARVRFVEDDGDGAPHASTVAVA
ncbi:MAG TPA: HPF/RaiA family ribosome-associated protein [Polyangiaceae bacterium]|nr:HPF/RaiA family ribosome-associated protein [Polyangiaceae bacterium]